MKPLDAHERRLTPRCSRRAARERRGATRSCCASRRAAKPSSGICRATITPTQWVHDPSRLEHAGRRPVRSARGRGRGARDGQAHEPRAADPVRSRASPRFPTATVARAAQDPRRHARPAQRAAAPRRPRRHAAAVAGARGRVRRQRRPVARARRRGRRAPAAHARCCRPKAISYEWAGDQQPVASNATEAGRAQNRRVEVEVWYDEVEQGTALDEVLVEEEFRRVKVCRIEDGLPAALRRRQRAAHARAERRARRCASATRPSRSRRPTSSRSAKPSRNLSDRHNVLVKFIGYTDDAPLPRAQRAHLRRPRRARRARRRAASRWPCRKRLSLPTSAVDSDGRGTTRPLGSNATAQGRALNRRVEVEFWYDDPLQELPDEPQLCPAPGNELVTRVYDPPWGALPRARHRERRSRSCRPGFTGLLRRGARRRRRQDECAPALRRLYAQRAARAAHDARLRRRHRPLGRARAPRDGAHRGRHAARAGSKSSSRAAATCTPTTSSTRASSRARRRTSSCRSSTTRSPSSTTTTASTSRR